MHERDHRPGMLRRARRTICPLLITGTAIFGIAYVADVLAKKTTGLEDVLTPSTASSSPTPEPTETAQPESTATAVFTAAPRTDGTPRAIAKVTITVPTEVPTPESTSTVQPEPTPEPTPIPQPTATAEPTPTEIAKEPESAKDLQFEIGPAEKVSLSGIQYYPDGHVSFIRMSDGMVRVWMAGSRYGYMISGESINSLTNPEKVIVPTSRTTEFDSNYAAPGSVIPGKNEEELLMIYHGERHHQGVPFPFKAGIGLAISQDAGKTWEKKGQIIKGFNENLEKDKPSGAGQPSAIIKDNYIYLYYVDWNNTYPDAIHLARAPIDSNGMPETWEKFNNGQFENKGLDGPSSPVILPTEEQGYTALPGVSWNSYLEKFLMVFESRDGFHVATSVDLINWSKPTILLEVITGPSKPKSGQTWNSYPTLISPRKPNDRETDENMILLYSEGKFNQGSHSMRARPITLK